MADKSTMAAVNTSYISPAITATSTAPSLVAKGPSIGGASSTTFTNNRAAAAALTPTSPTAHRPTATVPSPRNKRRSISYSDSDSYSDQVTATRLHSSSSTEGGGDRGQTTDTEIIRKAVEEGSEAEAKNEPTSTIILSLLSNISGDLPGVKEDKEEGENEGEEGD
jgi:hypothetical protein